MRIFVELCVTGHHSTSKTSAHGRTPPLLHGARNVSKSLHIRDEEVQMGGNTNPILHLLKVNEVISFAGFLRVFFPCAKAFYLAFKNSEGSVKTTFCDLSVERVTEGVREKKSETTQQAERLCKLSLLRVTSEFNKSKT